MKRNASVVASAADKARWDKLRAAYALKKGAADDFECSLRAKYGANYGSWSQWHNWISRGEKTKLERMHDAADKIGKKIIDLIVKISPRGEKWLTGAPAFWLREKLTWEDATRPVNEPLSVEVPAPYGAMRGVE